MKSLQEIVMENLAAARKAEADSRVELDRLIGLIKAEREKLHRIAMAIEEQNYTLRSYLV